MTAPTNTHQYGIVTQAEVLVNQLRDGTDINAVWDEFRDLLVLINTDRATVAGLLSYATINSADAVPQNLAVAQFERATELGVPRGAGLPGDTLLVGFDFYPYDLATRMTAQFLMNADIRQVRAMLEGVISGDNALVTGRILHRLMTPTEWRNDQGHRVFGLWNGTDNLTPPPFLGRTFDEAETHYVASGAAELDSADVEDAVKLVTRKGFGTTPGSQMLIIANDDEADAIMSWQAGVESRTGGPKASHDFVPSKNAPVYLSEKTIVGELAPPDFHGIKVLGSYGESWLLRSAFIPAGYVVVTASYGLNHPLNPVGFREHPVESYRGLRQIAGPWTGYPLLESFHVRNFGVGVRNRGSAAVVQVTADDEYTAPPKSAFGLSAHI